VLRAAIASSLRNTVEFLAKTTTPILASGSLASGSSGAVVSQVLPEDQWKIELQYWHSVSMAHLQRTIVQYATGQIAAEPDYLVAPTAEQDIWFCQNLIVPSAVYQSFSVMALILIFLVGLLVIIASLNVERLAALIRRWLRRGKSAKSWNHDYVLGIKPVHKGSPNTKAPEKDSGQLRPPSTSQQRESEIFEWDKIPHLPKDDENLSHQQEGRRTLDIKSRLSPFRVHFPNYPPPRPPRDSQEFLIPKNFEKPLPEAPKKAMGAEKEKRFSRLYFRPAFSLNGARASNHPDVPQGNWI